MWSVTNSDVSGAVFTTQGTWQKYQEGKWQEVDPTDLLRLTKHEGQPWLVLFNLMVLLAAATLVVLFVCVCVVAVCLGG